MDLKPTLIRGNASEVMAVAGAVGSVRGVDSTASAAEALELGQTLARRVGCVVAISGATDLVRVPQLCLCSVARIPTWPAVQDCVVGVSGKPTAGVTFYIFGVGGSATGARCRRATKQVALL